MNGMSSRKSVHEYPIRTHLSLIPNLRPQSRREQQADAKAVLLEEAWEPKQEQHVAAVGGRRM